MRHAPSRPGILADTGAMGSLVTTPLRSRPLTPEPRSIPGTRHRALLTTTCEFPPATVPNQTGAISRGAWFYDATCAPMARIALVYVQERW